MTLRCSCAATGRTTRCSRCGGSTSPTGDETLLCDPRTLGGDLDRPAAGGAGASRAGAGERRRDRRLLGDARSVAGVFRLVAAGCSGSTSLPGRRARCRSTGRWSTRGSTPSGEAIALRARPPAVGRRGGRRRGAARRRRRPAGELGTRRAHRRGGDGPPARALVGAGRLAGARRTRRRVASRRLVHRRPERPGGRAGHGAVPASGFGQRRRVAGADPARRVATRCSSSGIASEFPYLAAVSYRTDTPVISVQSRDQRIVRFLVVDPRDRRDDAAARGHRRALGRTRAGHARPRARTGG